MESLHKNTIHLLSQTVEEWQRFKTRLSTYQHCTVPELNALSASLAGFIYSKEHDVLSCSDCSLKVTDVTTHLDFIALHMATDSAHRCTFLNWYRENLYRGQGKSILHKYIHCYRFCFIFLNCYNQMHCQEQSFTAMGTSAARSIFRLMYIIAIY